MSNRLEYEIDRLNDKISRAERDYKEAREALTRELSDPHEIIIPVFVQQYANRMAEAYRQLNELTEQLVILRSIQQEIKND